MPESRDDLPDPDFPSPQLEFVHPLGRGRARKAAALSLCAAALLVAGCANRDLLSDQPAYQQPADSAAVPATSAATPAPPREGAPVLRQTLRNDLGPLLTEAEEAAIDTLAEGRELAEWLEDFWYRRDPTPTTPENERLEEHYCRLAVARGRFPAKEPPYYDLRGRDWILFGPPTQVLQRDVMIDAVYNPRREAWIWKGLGYIAEYWDFDLDGVYTAAGPIDKAIDPRTFRQSILTGVWDHGYKHLPFTPARSLVMKAEYEEAVFERRDSYVPDIVADLLWAVFSADCFRGEGGLTRVEIAYQLRPADLSFLPDPARRGWRGRLRQSMVFIDRESRPRGSVRSTVELERPGLEAEDPELLLAGLMASELAPGRYRVALRLEDLNGERLRLQTTELRVPSFTADSLAVSDIRFATAVSLEPEPALFRKGEWNVAPHPLRSFTPALPVKLYFEVYGLAVDSRGNNHYRVSYRIVPALRESTLSRLWTREDVSPGELSATVSHRQTGESARHPLQISAADLGPGVYSIVIEVEDLIADRVATRRDRFRVLPGGIE